MPDIKVKKVTANDAAEIFHLVESCRPYLRQWLPWVDSTKSVNDLLVFIVEFKDKNLFYGREPYVIRVDKKIAGMIDLQNGDRYNKKAEIGYWLAQQYQGKGIITSACKVLLKKAFDEYGINRVTIKVAVDNLKSRGIPERLGFYLEGVERQGEFLNGVFVDLFIYSMLRSEWNRINLK